MIKGGRNDPKWVSLYKEKQKERVARRMAIFQNEMIMMMQLDDSINQLRRNGERQDALKLAVNS